MVAGINREQFTDTVCGKEKNAALANDGENALQHAGKDEKKNVKEQITWVMHLCQRREMGAVASCKQQDTKASFPRNPMPPK